MNDNTEILNAIQTAFNELKAKDAELEAQIATKGAGDTVTVDEIAKINSAISDLEAKINRPTIETADADADEYKAEFNAFARKGIEVKSVNNTDHGVALPKVVETGIYTALRTLSPMRAISRVIPVSSPDFRMLVNGGGTASGWVAETAARPETAAPTLSEIAVPMGELYAQPFVTQRALDDLSFDVEAFLASEIAFEFARAEGAAFLTGDGSGKPSGLLSVAGMNFVKSGQAAAMPTTIDPFVSMIQSLKQGYRANGKWLISAAQVATLRTMKDTTGQYLWQQSLVAGTPSTFLGYQVIECEDMPTVAANAFPIAFGDFERAYTIVDRTGVSTLRDPYSNKPYVSFYATKRVGGVVRDKSAFVALKIAA